MRALWISSMVVLALASPAAAVTRDQQTSPSIHDDASLNAAMLQYRFSLEEFAWYNPYMPGETSSMGVAPAEETGAASGEPAVRQPDREEDAARAQFLGHVWSDP